jgi:ATP-dependent helicase/nuclease subunit A
MTGSARDRQVLAASPDRSTWLTANAGSGKTRVLTNRVARLLLAGVTPQNILCLTYTKAAAGEMQNRLFQTLGAWAMMPDDALEGALAEIGESVSGGGMLANARRLFAQAIETPGGLKIQTIHAFCGSILRQFPLEARVSPRFREIEEREQLLMLRTLFDRFAEGPDAALLDAIAAHLPQVGLEEVLGEIVGYAEAFARNTPDDEIRRWFGVPQGETSESVLDELLADWPDDFVAAVAAAYAGGKTNDQARGAKLSDWMRIDDPMLRKGVLEGAFFTAKQQRFGTLATNDLKASRADLFDDLDARVDRLWVNFHRMQAVIEAERSIALHRFGRRYCSAYAQEKLAHGVLDFDDLISRTLALLDDPGVAEWVLYRLDGGIDHILVDEAQDTNPKQWAIIERLAREFSSGIGARGDIARTIFAVGDPKQSIYSFQGADPAEFARLQDEFSRRLDQSGLPLQRQELLHSFRSSPVILGLVDRVFGTGAAGAGGPTRHLAYWPELPGRVDLWPMVAQPDKDAPPPWHDPCDRTTPARATLELAASIAREIARMLRDEAVPDKEGPRPLRAGDILILVRRRAFITEALIAELKRAGLPVAGADQIALNSDLAAMDVVAVLKFLDTPADSLSLAAALRSPLFGFTEGDLYDIAHGRGDRTLWESLLASGRHPDAVAMLTDLRQKADFLRPFELIGQILVGHKGRERLVARLGREVEESLDILMDQAVAFEAAAVPSLTGFLAWHEVDGVKVKREADSGADAIRVMTVHGAKGLESPVVVLPDTADVAGGFPEKLYELPGGRPIFYAKKRFLPSALATGYAEVEQAQQDEADRLFYVALTRAKTWLIVCGAGTAAPNRDSWHLQVASAMQALGARDLGEGRLRLEHGAWPGRPEVAPPAAETPAIPDWAATAAPPAPERALFVRPSSLGQGDPSHTTGDMAAEEAALHGRLLHLLLEHLPRYAPADWPHYATLLLTQQDEPVGDGQVADLLSEARAVLAAPDLAPLFAAEALSEVDVTSALPEIGGKRMLGRIDRLLRTDRGLLAIDYKSHATVPSTPDAVPFEVLVQMGCYDSALRQIFPGTPVDVAVLWTRQARLMMLPHEMVTAALAATTS